MSILKETREDGYQMGPTTVTLDDEGYVIRLPTQIRDKVTAGGEFRCGEIIGVDENAQQDAARDAEVAQQKFANTVKLLVGNMVSDKSMKGKVSGHRDVVKQVLTLANLEKRYLKDMLAGKAAEEPFMLKTKAEIDKEAKNLTLLTGLKWPFN